MISPFLLLFLVGIAAMIIVVFLPKKKHQATTDAMVLMADALRGNVYRFLVNSNANLRNFVEVTTSCENAWFRDDGLFPKRSPRIALFIVLAVNEGEVEQLKGMVRFSVQDFLKKNKENPCYVRIVFRQKNKINKRKGIK